MFARLVLSVCILALFLSGSAMADDVVLPKAFRVFIGTYTGKESKGIYMGRLDLASGTLGDVTVAAEIENPSFLAIHPSRKYLYAVGEMDAFDGKKTGAVSAFAIDPQSGTCKLLNQQPSEGAGPCHLVVDATGKHVLVANYGGGSVASLPILDDGKLGSATSAIQHKGMSVDKSRQAAPHAHSINLDPANKFAFAADLGLDQVLIYKFDAATGKLAPNELPYAKVAGGAGPRHFAFHPTGKFAWVINEMGNTVTGFAFDPGMGVLTEIQTITTLPADFKGTSHTAEVVVHPSGKFLYGSNRGHDSLAIYKIDEATGKLTAAGHQLTGGKTPRNFAIEPTGHYLLAENQASGTVVVFRIDQSSGSLKQVGEPVRVPSPVCVRFVPL